MFKAKSVDWPMLPLRIMAGLGMATHGYPKIFEDGRFEKFVTGVEALGFPLPFLFAGAAALTELVGGLLLALGLFTRPAAAFIFMTMVVAVFGQHWDDPFSRKEMGLLYMSMALFFAWYGAGRFSLDAKYRKIG